MHWIRQILEHYAERTACQEAGRRWSYREVLNYIDNIKALLGENVPAGTAIALPAEPCLEGLAAILAIDELGLIALPLPADLTATERSRQLEIGHASYELHTGTNPTLSPLTAAPPPELFQQLGSSSGLILFSSGTSGAPKAMLHNLRNLLRRYESVRPRNDSTLQLLLNDHIGGLDAAFRSLFAGSKLVVPKARTPEATGRAIEQHAINIVPASPTFLNLMLIAKVPTKYDCSTVEVIAYGAEPMSQSLLHQLAKAFPQASLQQKFGTSETGAVRIKSTANESLFFHIEDQDTEWKVLNSELWLKTPSRILGYLNADETSLESDGWYRTGDLVEEGDNGSIRIIGRESDWINVGGQKVHPAEIMAVINQLPEVDACQVYAKPDSITGSAIACKITTQSNDDNRAWKRRIRSHCRGQLAPWKVPSTLIITQELGANQRMKRA